VDHRFLGKMPWWEVVEGEVRRDNVVEAGFSGLAFQMHATEVLGCEQVQANFVSHAITKNESQALTGGDGG